MQIFILGAGNAGKSVARFLSGIREHDVTVIDDDEATIATFKDQIDAACIRGSMLDIGLLREQGIESADLCLALSGNDNTNIVAASLAKGLGARRVAARVFSTFFNQIENFNFSRHFNIDRFLCDDYLTAQALVHAITGTMIEYFAHGDLVMQKLKINNDSNQLNRSLKELKFPSEVRVGTITRANRTFIAQANDMVLLGDELMLFGPPKQTEQVKKLFNIPPDEKKTVVIVGGSGISFFLARLLKTRNFRVKIYEKDLLRAEEIHAKLDNSVDVLTIDARRKDALISDGVGPGVIFVATTHDDETNIISCIEAKHLGAERTLAVIRHEDYADTMEKLNFFETVTPHKAFKEQVDGLLHTGVLRFENRVLLKEGVRIIELDVEENSPVTRAPLKDCGLKGFLAMAVAREQQIKIPSADFRLQANDTVLAIAAAEEIPKLITAFEANRPSG